MADAALFHASKRRRLGAPDWTIVFDDVSALRCIADTVAALMTRVTFNIKRPGPGDAYLVVNGSDMERSCAVSCHLELDRLTIAKANTTEFSFCIDAKQLLNSLDTPSCMQGCLCLEGHSSTAEVRLQMCDPDQRSHVSSSVLSTFVNDDPSNTIRPLEYEFLLEVDLHCLREIIKKGRKSRAEHLGIEVFFLPAQGSASEWSQVYFVVTGEDNSSHDQCFTNEITKSEGGDTIVRAANPPIEASLPALTHGENEEPLFRGSFSLDKVEAFIKNVPSKMICVQMRNGSPIMFTHFLRPGDSPDRNYVRFLAASCHED